MSQAIGLTGYENWKKYLLEHDLHSIFEVQLYSDAHITNEFSDLKNCPYEFLNAVPAKAIGSLAHVITLRIHRHVRLEHPDMSKTDSSRYHGGWLVDEVSSLVGLLMGIRLRGGDVTRHFDSNKDPRGRPSAETSVPVSPIPQFHRAWIIPRAHTSSLDIHKSIHQLFLTYPKISPSQSIALVRASRLYQDALWISESEPELAWLFFVSAIEVVAVEHQVSSFDYGTLLKNSYPELSKYLEEQGGETLLKGVSTHLAKLLRATGRFIDFVIKYLPQHPPRPDKNFFSISWETKDLKRALSVIYDYRSRALHDGTPFPSPMCEPPMLGGFHHEKPGGLASATHEGSWRSEDLPMLLHVFEHIVRGCIINWWTTIIGTKP